MESWEGTENKVFVVATMPLHFFKIDKRGLQCTQSVALFKQFTHYGSRSGFSYHDLTTLSIYSLYNCTPQFLFPEKTTDLPQVTDKLKGNATDLIVITHTLLYPKVLCPQRYVFRKVLMNVFHVPWCLLLRPFIFSSRLVITMSFITSRVSEREKRLILCLFVSFIFFFFFFFLKHHNSLFSITCYVVTAQSKHL